MIEKWLEADKARTHRNRRYWYSNWNLCNFANRFEVIERVSLGPSKQKQIIRNYSFQMNSITFPAFGGLSIAVLIFWARRGRKRFMFVDSNPDTTQIWNKVAKAEASTANISYFRILREDTKALKLWYVGFWNVLPSLSEMLLAFCWCSWVLSNACCHSHNEKPNKPFCPGISVFRAWVILALKTKNVVSNFLVVQSNLHWWILVIKSSHNVKP